MESKNRDKAKEMQKEVAKNANKPIASDSAASKRARRKGASDEQAAVQSEYVTSSGEAAGSNKDSEGKSDDIESEHREKYQSEENSFDEYNPVTNPAGMNTERESPSAQRGNDSQQKKMNEPDDVAENTGAGPEGIYESAQKRFPNQDRIDPGVDYSDFNKNPDHEDQRQGYVDPDRGGYEEGGYEPRNRPENREGKEGYSQEYGLSGRREEAGNRYDATSEESEEARRNIERRSNYDSPASGTDASEREKDLEKRGEDKHPKRKSKENPGSDDPYRDYDWTSRNRDV